jgi:hypothetical protein
MANWCNVRLVVIGPRPSVAVFAQQAKTAPAQIFRSYMLVGESGELISERMEKFGSAASKRTYSFQGRSDDGLNHFKALSRTYPELRLILAFGEAGDDRRGSYLVRRGRVRKFTFPQPLWDQILAKHGYGPESGDDGEYWKYCEAEWEALDVSVAHWERVVRKELGSDGARKPSS